MNVNLVVSPSDNVFRALEQNDTIVASAASSLQIGHISGVNDGVWNWLLMRW